MIVCAEKLRVTLYLFILYDYVVVDDGGTVYAYM